MNRKKIDDVIAEMREFVQACDTNELACPCDPGRVLMYKGMKLRDVAEKWVDELADGQECLPHFEYAVLDVEKVPGGNIAAMREAMKVANETADELLAWIWNHYQELNCMGGRLKRAVESALSDPPRNCDRLGGDYKKLHAKWFEWTGTPEGHNQDGTAKMAFGEWLLALAPVDRSEEG